MDNRHSAFDPVVRADTRLLLCGSLPGARSLAERRYYANPRNQFWRLMGAVIDRPLADLSYDERLATLLDHGIGLWDVVASARRTGSLDGAIRDAVPHDLAGLTATLPALRGVAFNGAAAARIGGGLLAGTGIATLALPSSSPAYTLPFADKADRWLRLRAWLTPP